MNLSKVIDQFIQDITDLSTNQPLDDALERAMIAEKHLRHLFATDPHNRLLEDLFVGLIDGLWRRLESIGGFWRVIYGPSEEPKCER